MNLRGLLTFTFIPTYSTFVSLKRVNIPFRIDIVNDFLSLYAIVGEMHPTNCLNKNKYLLNTITLKWGKTRKAFH